MILGGIAGGIAGFLIGGPIGAAVGVLGGAVAQAVVSPSESTSSPYKQIFPQPATANESFESLNALFDKAEARSEALYQDQKARSKAAQRDFTSRYPAFSAIAPLANFAYDAWVQVGEWLSSKPDWNNAENRAAAIHASEVLASEWGFLPPPLTEAQAGAKGYALWVEMHIDALRSMSPRAKERWQKLLRFSRQSPTPYEALDLQVTGLWPVELESASRTTNAAFAIGILAGAANASDPKKSAEQFVQRQKEIQKIADLRFTPASYAAKRLEVLLQATPDENQWY